MTNDNEHPGRWKDDEYRKIYGLYMTLKSTDEDNSSHDLVVIQEMYRNPSWGYINRLYDRVEQLERERDNAVAAKGVQVGALHIATEQIAALKAGNTALLARVSELLYGISEIKAERDGHLKGKRELVKKCGEMSDENRELRLRVRELEKENRRLENFEVASKFSAPHVEALRTIFNSTSYEAGWLGKNVVEWAVYRIQTLEKDAALLAQVRQARARFEANSRSDSDSIHFFLEQLENLRDQLELESE